MKGTELLLALLLNLAIAGSFVIPVDRCSVRKAFLTHIFAEDGVQESASDILARARELREQISEQERNRPEPVGSSEYRKDNKWNVPVETTAGIEQDRLYRLEIDIGREEGSWMDPRWAASGRRIEMTLDVLFTNEVTTRPEIVTDMVDDNFSGKKSSVQTIVTASHARLRQGFAEMKCDNGAFRIDSGNKGQTARFFVYTEGHDDGDVSIPKGPLYFSLPAFGGARNLSQKLGVVSVRQYGWHTGWRRLESRIVGTFKAIPMEKAKQRDRF